MKNILKNKPKRSTIQQLQDLKLWSQNPTAYEKKLKAFVRSEDPVPRNERRNDVRPYTAPPKKEIKVAGIKDTALYKTLKDPRVLGIDLGTDTIREIINLIQNSGLVKKPRPEPNIPIEEKIRRFAQAKQNDTEQIGVASLLGIPKKFSR